LSTVADPAVGTNLIATVSCPTGKLLIGGGGQATASGAGNNFHTQVQSSYPLANNAWRVTAMVTAPLGPGSAMELRPCAICGS
jgi:hypothetical protein